MAIYGFGALYGSTDVSAAFVQHGVACVGWKKEDALPIHSIFRHLKIGDIAFIKAHPPSVGLIIKAVGIVTNDEPVHPKGLGIGIPVRWIWHGKEIRLGKFKDCYPVRNLTLYEEHNPKIQKCIIDLLLGGLK